MGMRIQGLASGIAIVATSLSAAAFGDAHAQSAGGDAEIAALKQQLRLMEQKLDKLQRQTAANTAAAATANAKADAKVSVANTAATVPQRLDDGANVRRARIGVIGKFMSDWNYALIYDFGGASDGFGSTASVGGAAVGFLPGGALSGIENAYLSYTGFKPFGGKLAIEGGVMDLPYTLDEASSSNDIPFMERASSGITATNIAAGDFRSAFGARWYTDTFWAGAYVTGPATGAIHSASSLNPPGTTEQYGAFARVAGQIVSGKDYSLHI